MIHVERRSVCVATVVLVSVLAVSVGFVTPVAAQSVEDIQTTLTDESGDGLDDRVQVNVTVSNVQSGQTIVELGESNFDADVSSTSTGQAQFVTPQDTDGDGTPEAVEFVTVGTTSTTYTVVADLSNQTDGDTGTVNVELGGGKTDSVSFTVGGQGGEDGSDDGSDGDGEGDGNEETDGQNDGSASDGGSETTDGTQEGSDGTGTGGGSDGADGGSGSEGLPGFTTVVALLALVVSAAYYRMS